MTARSKNLPDQTVPVRSPRRSFQQPPSGRKTRDTDLPAGKISLKPTAQPSPAKRFAETEWPPLHRPDTAPIPIPHSAVTQQNRR